MLNRKRTETEYILIGICAILGTVITPFAVIRFVSGEYALAALDAALMAGTLAICIYVYRTGKTTVPGYIAAGVFIFGAISTVHLRGVDQVHWAYPALVIVFYFLHPKLALALSGFAIFAILPAIEPVENPLPALKVFSTLAVNVVCAFLFAIVTRRQSAKLHELTKRDPLTQIGNRSAMDLAISKVFAEHQKVSKAVSALMIDIDYFKEVNDNHGHQVGDSVLIKVAELIEGNVRTSESVYRYGGEEFLVIAREMAVDDAKQLAERLREKVEQYEFENKIKITISVGVAEVNDTDSTRQWLRRADQALYHAKENGRNCVMSFDNCSPCQAHDS